MGPLWIVPLLPLLAVLTILLLPRRSVRSAGGIAVIAAGLAIQVMAGHLAAVHRGVQHVSSTRLTLGGRTVEVGLAADPLSAVMALLVAITATLVLIYSIGYMADDPDKRRFFAVMSLFAGAMLALVLASDFLLLYLSWEIVGLCSYLLIGHYWQQRKASRAALKAFVVTRIGDMGLLIAVAMMLITVGSTRFDTVFSAVRSGTVSQPFVTYLAILVLLGTLGKSAQFPLHWWLPDAMAGPTPVSALIHSATMVAAGMYLLARSFQLIAAAPIARDLLLVAALGTSIGAALAAAVQADVKRLLAYSTMSQLGEMGIALAIGAPFAAIFHLIAHASFKALLFLASGIVTSSGSNELSSLPSSRIARWAFFAGALSLSGIPPFSGFWSKEAIASAAPPAIQGVLALLSLLSAFYIGRAFLLGFVRHARQESRQPLSAGFSLYIFTALTLVGGIGWWWLPDLLGARRPEVGWSAAVNVTLALTAWAVTASIYRWQGVNPLPLRERFAGLIRVLQSGIGTDYLPRMFAHNVMATFQLFSVFDTRLLDRLASQTAKSVLRASSGASIIETQGFDRFSASVASGALRMGRRTNWLDLRVLDRSVLASAFSLREFGGRVRALQTGRVYHYIAAVFFWVILAGAIAWAVRR